MYFVGVDLAWGEKRPTGLAVLDAVGALLALSSQRTDAEIDAAVGEFVAGDCLVAIDAPLIVTNPTGNRPCEAALNRDFARFHAGAHPSNTGRAEFRDSPRGARLAARFGLDLDPSSLSTRRAIEVYPHPATVALFELGRTLQYKHKPGRPLTHLRSELLRLMSLLEGLTADPPLHLRDNDDWRALDAQVKAADRKSDLRRAEDQVDAVVCAYVGLYASRHPAAMTTYGDVETGYIVTPTLPAGLVPSPRERQDPARSAVQVYAAAHAELTGITDRFVDLVTSQLDDAGINYLTVTGRTKSVESFAEKAERTLDGVRLFPEPLTQITDTVGIRIITYVLDDVTAVANLLADQLTVLEDRDMGVETARAGRFGYASRHLLVSVGHDPAATGGTSTTGGTGPPHGVNGSSGLGGLGGRIASIQIRTVLQHAWAEFEHEIRYKGTIPEAEAPDLNRRFTLAAGLLELADREFSTIRTRITATRTGHTPPAEADDPRLDAQDLANFLAGQFTDAGWSRADHYEWIGGLLLELGITSLDELGGMLGSIDDETITSRMGYRYPPGAVRRLDDALLAVYGSRYLHLHGNAHRTDLLRARLDKLRAPVTS